MNKEVELEYLISQGCRDYVVLYHLGLRLLTSGGDPVSVLEEQNKEDPHWVLQDLIEDLK